MGNGLARFCIFAVPALLPFTLGGEATPAPKEVRAAKASGPIKIDGKLDEEAWRQAGSFLLRSADGKREASRRTTVRILHDRERIYVAFECEDPDVWTDHRGRDSHMWTEDVVEVFIDPDPRDPGYVELEVNPLGDLFDGMFFQLRRQVLMSWNPAIELAVGVEGTVNRRDDTDRSWTVEMAIPVGDLALSEGVGRPGAELRSGTSFTINFYRNERTKEGNELQAWAPVRGDFHETGLFGRVIFE
jgi:hypothetical protein